MESSGRSIHMPYPVLAVSALEVVEERVAVGAAVVVGNGIVDAGADRVASGRVEVVVSI